MKLCLNKPLYGKAVFLMALSFELILNPVRVNTLPAQDIADESLLENAEEAYYDEDFPKAINLVDQYLKQPRLTDDKIETAHILLVHIYLAKNDTASAKQSVLEILQVNPEYTPTLEMETPKYVGFVSMVKDNYTVVNEPVVPKVAIEEQDSSSVNWYVIGGAGAAITTLTIILLSSGDGQNGNGAQPLALPPELPK